MDSMYTLIGVGILLLSTMFLNAISQEMEYRAQQKRLKILDLQRVIDEISDYLVKLEHLKLPFPIQNFLLNEIIARFLEIKETDEKFPGIEQLIEKANNKFTPKTTENPDESDSQTANEEAQKEVSEKKSEQNILSEEEIHHELSIIRSLTAYIGQLKIKHTEDQIFTNASAMEAMIAFRFDFIYQCYLALAKKHLANEKYVNALDDMHKVKHSIMNSPYKNEAILHIKTLVDEFESEIRNQMRESLERIQRETQKKRRKHRKKSKKNSSPDNHD